MVEPTGMPRRARLVALVTLVLAGALALPAVATSPDPVAEVAGNCDPIDPAHCLLPFPNDFHTVADPTTDTGRRVNFDLPAMPKSVAGKPIDPAEWNRNDGFSPGALVMTYVPGLDLHRTWGTHGLPERERDHLAHVARYTRAGAPIVILNAETGKRHPFWSELDTHPGTTDERRLLLMRPAVNFEEGTRYIVALRRMRRADGSLIPAGEAFANYRDGGPAGDAGFEARRAHMEGLFERLGTAGVARSDLYLAWDLTVASERNLAERALHIRDDAFGLLGDTDLANGIPEGEAPAFTVDTVTDFAEADNRSTMRRVEGTLTVPNYLTPQVRDTVTSPVEVPELGSELPVAAPGSRFNYVGSDDGLPRRNPVQPDLEVEYVCNVPRTAEASPARAMLYGHGLLGGREEANGSSTEDMRLRGFAPCAVDWIGMAFEDIPNVATILTDVTNFSSLADRAQQGFLNFLYLGRALLHAEGLTSHDAFRGADGRPLVASGRLFYDGNSQGGIMGGALTALAPDFRTAVLGVPGMNYSTLLNRSVDWEGQYAEVMYAAYPDKLEQQLTFGLIQMLWDRAEGNGYAHHMTSDPLAGTPPHQVMLQVAFADHQVANVAAEVEGRTIGAKLHVPALAPGQHWSVDPEFGFRQVRSSDRGGSYLVYWYAADRDNTTPPNGNVPSTSGDDPHGDPRKDNAGSDQKATFLTQGRFVDVCGGPCVTVDETRSN